jgi:peptidyl-dipeptidase Dcp
VYDNRHQSGLNPEEIKLTENYFNSRIKNGIGLSKEKQERLLLIDEKLTELSRKFYSNVMQDTENKFLNIKDSSVLSGLPKDVLDKAKKDAANRGKNGWIFTTSPTSDNPFLNYVDNRELRKVYYGAYAKIGANQNENNNEKIVLNIANLRLEKANILGYNTYADYALMGSMAQDKENVKLFLETQQSSLLPLAIGEYEELNSFARSIGFNSSIQSWDWHYYSQKLKAQKYDIEDAEIKEYFPYAQVQTGVFNLVERLWGLKFVLNQNIPVYHPNVVPFEVYEENGDLLGILMLDLFDREQKGDIGHMSLHRPQLKQNGKRIIPIVGITDSYPNPEGDIPSLLSMIYVKSFLHEMGHALHGLFSDVTYRSLSGTTVDKDFLEFPSTLMEQWLYEKSFLETIAFHYKTGEKMPSEMMDNLIASNLYQQAYHGFNINSLSMVDFAWHSLTQPIYIPITQFEEKILPKNQYSIHSERIISTSLIYIFSYGYASFLYSYDWCDMIAKDAFLLFQENGIYNRKIAADLRTHILSKGGSEHPMTLYKRFRGMEPDFKSRSNMKK